MKEEYQGYYSIIQYCPSIERTEAVNVGVVLLIPSMENQPMWVRMDDTNGRVRSWCYWGGVPFDEQRFNSAKQAFVHRLETGILNVGDFMVFGKQETGEFLLTHRRSILIQSPQEDLDDLFKHLVKSAPDDHS
jgi:hypothetical protein